MCTRPAASTTSWLDELNSASETGEPLGQLDRRPPGIRQARSADPDIGQNVTVTFINTNNGQTLATGTRVGTTNVYRAIWTPTGR